MEHIESLYVSGHFAFDPKEKFEFKVSKRCYYFIEPQKKVGPKSHILTLYKVSCSEDLGILGLRSISIGFHTVKNMLLSVHFFWRFDEVVASF